VHAPPPLPTAALLALLLAAPQPAAAQRGGADGRRGVALPESSLRLMLRNREALGLDAGQVLTLELKESELQLRLAARLEALGKRSGAGRGGGPGGGAGGPPGGGGGEMGGPGGGGMGGGGGQGMGLQGGVSPEGVQAGLTLPGVPGGGPSVSSGPGGGGAAPEAALAELAALDRAAVDGVRMIFRPEQLPGVDRLVALRAEALARRGPRPQPDRPPEGAPPPAAPK